jgi:hypothetical protein
MDMAFVTKDLRAVTTKSSLLWGVAVGTLAILFLDHFRETTSIPADWYWVLPLVAAMSWGIIAAGLVSMAIPHVSHWLEARAEEHNRRKYAARNFLAADTFEKGVLMHCKRRDQQRFKARDVQGLHEMVREGLLDNDSLDRRAVMQHYMIPDTVWGLLDDPPKGWADGVAAPEVTWSSQPGAPPGAVSWRTPSWGVLAFAGRPRYKATRLKRGRTGATPAGSRLSSVGRAPDL